MSEPEDEADGEILGVYIPGADVSVDAVCIIAGCDRPRPRWRAFCAEHGVEMRAVRWPDDEDDKALAFFA